MKTFAKSLYVQGDTKKTVITKNRITSKILFRLTQKFSCIRSSLCSRHLQSFKSVLQKLAVGSDLLSHIFGTLGEGPRAPIEKPAMDHVRYGSWLLVKYQ